MIDTLSMAVGASVAIVGYWAGSLISKASADNFRVWQSQKHQRELLDALKTVVHWIDPTGPGEPRPEDPRPPSEVVKQAREVIAKAEGR